MSANREQAAYWNEQAGPVWVRYQEQLDRQIEPLGRAAIAALEPRPGERILDIGCGAGQTTLALAARVAPGGFVMGADISKPLLQLARARPPGAGVRVAFEELDAQVDDLARAGGGPFDAAFSRFGVMFFADPVAAFRNIRKALRPGGRIAFVCWRPLVENAWMRAPLEAAAPLLPPMPAPDPLAPGPFAFADAARVESILGDAGFAGIACARHDSRIGSGGLERSLELALNVGPVGAMLREHPECRDKVMPAIRAALARYETAEGVVLPAATWIVTARSA